MLVSNLLNLIVQSIVLVTNVRQVLKHLSILIILFKEATSRILLTIRRGFLTGSILILVLTLIVVIVGVKNSIITKVEIFPFSIIGHFISFKPHSGLLIIILNISCGIIHFGYAVQDFLLGFHF